MIIAPLELGSDQAVRNEWFVPESFGHPAKLHLKLLQWLIDRYGLTGARIIDPMGGIGSTLYAAALQCDVVLREIEPAWLALAHRNAARIYERAGLLAGHMEVSQHDARQPWGVQGDVVLFSPPYGCAVAGRANSKVMSPEQIRRRLAKLERYDRAWDRLLRAYDGGAPGVRAAYTMHYGDHPAQVGAFRGQRYWEAMRPIYQNARAALRPGGLMILIIKDHVRKGQRVQICNQTVELCRSFGFRPKDRHSRRVQLSLWLRRRAEKGLPVVDVEEALVLEAV